MPDPVFKELLWNQITLSCHFNTGGKRWESPRGLISCATLKVYTFTYIHKLIMMLWSSFCGRTSHSLHSFTHSSLIQSLSEYLRGWNVFALAFPIISLESERQFANAIECISPPGSRQGSHRPMFHTNVTYPVGIGSFQLCILKCLFTISIHLDLDLTFDWAIPELSNSI